MPVGEDQSMIPIEIVVSGAEDGIVVSGQKEPVGVQVDPQKKGRVIQETKLP